MTILQLLAFDVGSETMPALALSRDHPASLRSIGGLSNPYLLAGIAGEPDTCGRTTLEQR